MTEPTLSKTAVFLGRFSPFQKGHASIVNMMIEKYGYGGCLVLIGSSNTLNKRTPYTFEQREEMIRKVYPEIKIMALPDGKPGLVCFDGTTNNQWLDSIEKIQEGLNTKFVFFGGSEEDLKILAERFQTEIAVDRNKTPGLSATRVREALLHDDSRTVNELLDSKIIPLAKKYYKEFIKKDEK